MFKFKISVLCTVLVLLSVLCSACGQAKSGSSSPKNEKNSGGVISETEKLKIDGMNFNSDICNVSKFGNILKIDAINSNMNSYSFNTVIYDISGNSLLSVSQFSDELWSTGLTSKGFFAININNKKCFIYEKNGKLKSEKSFAENHKIGNVCTLSPNEDKIIFNDPSNGEIILFDISKKSETVIDKCFLDDNLGFNNGKLYAVSVDGELVSLDIENKKLNRLVKDSSLTYYSPYCSVGKNDDSFSVYFDGKINSIEISSTDERVISTGENGFYTSVSNEQSETLRYYDLKHKCKYEMGINGVLKSACLINNKNIIAVTGSSADKKHEIAVIKLSDCVVSDINFE